MFDPAAEADDAARELTRRAWDSLRRQLIDLLFPPACPCCRQPVAAHHGLCAACWRGLRFITSPCCERLGAPFSVDPGPGAVSPAAIARPPPWERARAATRFEHTARTLAHALKFGDRPDLALVMARLMAIAGAPLLAEADLIVPVPLHRLRLWRRRHNQAAALAAALAGVSGRPCDPLALRRTRLTRPQTGLSRLARTRNLRGAFAVTPDAKARVAGKRLLLVDDVLTTGSTAAAATRALLRAGAARVDVLAFAMVVRD